MRCLFEKAGSPSVYEERVTLWTADTFEVAIERAETEAREYAVHLSLRYLGLAQAYHLFDSPDDGAEVFSLCRESDLGSDDYIEASFDTGTERQGHVESTD